MTLELAKPTKFVFGIRNIGVDTCNAHYKGQFENPNPVKLGLKICDVMGEQFAGKEHSAQFDYWLACSLLHNLQFDKERLLEDIDKANEKIEKFCLGDKK